MGKYHPLEDMGDYVNQNKETFDRLGTSATEVEELDHMAKLALPGFQMLLAGGRVLDVGCGVGIDSLRLKRHMLDVQGLDISEVMLAEAKRLVEGVPFWQGDFRALPFAPDSFDGVWANGSLFYVTTADLQQTLQEVRRILKTGGVFFASYLQGEGEFYRNSLYHHCYRPEELEQYYREAGFKTFDQSLETSTNKYVCILAVK
ncbi:class I SAM-dependent methyltransferase [Brevibacillus sp. B_LB10_24]|uniref:class I SAM-dependent methyltransferase n=1 Tax=Brevibacillus sp. B_LB10_24 TaxID=3380645 RepID=UPI0038B8615E